jgi:mannan endo-1,4-beta-mannosidase
MKIGRSVLLVASLAWIGEASGADPAPAASSRDAPVAPGAAPEAVALLEFLHRVSGKWILAGQQETVDWFGADNAPEFPYVSATTGREPAVRGFDFMFTSDSRNTHQRIAERIIAWGRRGGIATACFHWFAGPAGVYEGRPRQAFYTADTDFDLSLALTPGTAAHEEFVREMDVVAAELGRVRDAGVPVIWRPFHECDGGWFWWGAKGPAVFKQAWRFMFERFTQVHGLNNLLWCYNPTETAGAHEAWYPGDEYVDIVSLDVYPAAGTRPTYASDSARFAGLTGGRKPVALSENGAIPDPDELFADGARWSWFCTWNGFFTTDGVVNPADFLIRVYNHPRVLTLDELVAVRGAGDRAPVVLLEPVDVVAPAGTTVALSVLVGGSEPIVYRWFKDGAEISGEAGASLRIRTLDASSTGAYRVEATNAAGTIASRVSEVALGSGPVAAGGSRIVNLSTRGVTAGAGAEVIAGFVIAGPGSKRVLVRGVGPELAEFGVAVPMADPLLRLTTAQGVPLARSDDWAFDEVAAASAEAFTIAGAFPLVDGSRDAALVIDLPPGHYTAIVSPAVGGDGIVLAEIYDLDPEAAARLVNVSTRGTVGDGERVMIAGLVTAGESPVELLVRAVGPGLESHVANPLADPLLGLVRASDGSVLAFNEAWDGHGDVAALVAATARAGGFPLASGSRDAALLQVRPPGGYTAIVRGGQGASGTALVEIYEVPPGP